MKLRMPNLFRGLLLTTCLTVLCPNSSFGGELSLAGCRTALTELMIEDTGGADFLFVRSLEALLERNADVRAFLENNENERCTYNCDLPTGSASITFEMRNPDDFMRRYNLPVHATNTHNFSEVDPIYGNVGIHIIEETKNETLSSLHPGDGSGEGVGYDFSLAESAVRSKLHVLLKPLFLKSLATELAKKGEATETPYEVLQLISEMYFDRFETPLQVDSTPTSLIIRNNFGFHIDVGFANGDSPDLRNSIIRRIKISKQYRKSFTEVQVVFNSGNLKEISERYDQKEEARIQKLEEAERQKTSKMKREMDMSDGIYSTPPHPQNPHGEIGGNVFDKLVIFTISSQEIVLNGKLSFTMADSPRPKVFVFNEQSYQVNYMRDGIITMTSAEGHGVNGKYEKRSVVFSNEAQASEHMIDVALYLPNHPKHAQLK